MVVVVPLPLRTSVTPAGGLAVRSVKEPLARSTVIVTGDAGAERLLTAVRMVWASVLVAASRVTVDVVARTVWRFAAVSGLTVTGMSRGRPPPRGCCRCRR